MPSFANKWRKRLSSCLLELMSAGLTSLTSSWSSIIHPDFRDPRPLGRLERIKRPEELFRSISFAAAEPILTQRSKSKMRFLHICAIINVLEHGRWMNSSCSHGLCVTHMFAWNLAEVASTDLLWTRSPYRVYNPFCHSLRLPQAFGLSPLVQPQPPSAKAGTFNCCTTAEGHPPGAQVWIAPWLIPSGSYWRHPRNGLEDV